MKNILFITSVALFILACEEHRCSNGKLNKDEEAIDCGGPCMLCPIEYPAEGHFGLNILDQNTLNFSSGTGMSLHAKLPNETSLKIHITKTTSNFNAGWAFYPSSNSNLFISQWDDTLGQTFESVAGAEEVDLNLWFTGPPGSATIDIYENEATTPTRTKNITW